MVNNLVCHSKHICYICVTNYKIMLPIGNYIEIEPIEKPTMLIQTLSAYQEGVVKEISADIELPFVAGDTIYFVRGQKVYFKGRVFIALDYIELYKK